MLHRTLERQLKKAGLSADRAPALAQWQELLARVGRSYLEADQERYLLERGLHVSTSELQEVNAQLRRRSDKLLEDVGERLEVEAALRRSEESFRKIIDSFPEPIFMHRGESIIYVNEAVAQVWGSETTQELLGQSPIDRVHPDDRGVVLEKIRTVTDRPEKAIVVRMIRIDGLPILVEATGLVVTFEGLPTTLVLLRDVTERRRLEVELGQAQKLESVGRLAAGIAHEINTPVQFVGDSVYFVRGAVTELLDVVGKLGAVNRLVLSGEPAGEAAAAALRAEEAADLAYLAENVPKALDRAVEGLGRVATIVRSMKEFAHPDGKEMAAVDLNQAIQSTLVVARNEYKYVAELETDFGELPPVLCHVGELNQVILNVVVNAAQAIAGVVKGTERKGLIQVKTRAEKGDVIVSITDTGGGIPERIQERIFDPFFTTKEVGVGTGQGLNIARAVVMEKHGGKLYFDTVVGEGTTFFLRLPISGRPSVAGEV